jgi:hypothetical protein
MISTDLVWLPGNLVTSGTSEIDGLKGGGVGTVSGSSVGRDGEYEVLEVSAVG